MSLRRRVLRKRLKTASVGSKTPFANAWFRLQEKQYGFERAYVMHHVGNCNPSKITNQLKMKASGM